METVTEMPSTQTWLSATSSATLATDRGNHKHQHRYCHLDQVLAALAKPPPSRGQPLSGTSTGCTSRWSDSGTCALAVVRDGNRERRIAKR